MARDPLTTYILPLIETPTDNGGSCPLNSTANSCRTSSSFASPQPTLTRIVVRLHDKAQLVQLANNLRLAIQSNRLHALLLVHASICDFGEISRHAHLGHPVARKDEAAIGEPCASRGGEIRRESTTVPLNDSGVPSQVLEELAGAVDGDRIVGHRQKRRRTGAPLGRHASICSMPRT
jgi:hypothetical protein